MVGDREVRLFAIDAPEWGQRCNRNGKAWACGEEAAAELAKLVTGRDVRCVAVDTDEHGRTVSRCTVGFTDVNRTMVASGWAVAYRHYSLDYVPAENSAKAAKLGIWGGNFQMPSDYRHADTQVSSGPTRKTSGRKAVSRPSTVAMSSAGGCTIKGNQGSNGWIYHLPGMPFYERTKAEQMFCSEAEARAAGYRRAKVR